MREFMSLIRRQPVRLEDFWKVYCTLREAAQILGLDKSTIRKRLCGTENLTHYRRGKPGSQRAPIVLVRAEVVALRQDWEARQGQNPQDRAMKLVYGS